MQRFFFTTLKNHLPVQLPVSDPAPAPAPAPRAQPRPRMMIMTGQIQPRNIRIVTATTAAAPRADNNMLTRNIRDSQPIFSVSSIFGLKQGSCSSCGH